MEGNGLEFIAGGVAVLMLREVLGFLVRFVPKNNMGPMTDKLDAAQGDISAVLTLVKVLEDRERRFQQVALPALEATLRAALQRLQYVERDMALVKDRLNMSSGYTPVDGVPRVTLPPDPDSG